MIFIGSTFSFTQRDPEDPIVSEGDGAEASLLHESVDDRLPYGEVRAHIPLSIVLRMASDHHWFG